MHMHMQEKELMSFCKPSGGSIAATAATPATAAGSESHRSFREDAGEIAVLDSLELAIKKDEGGGDLLAADQTDHTLGGLIKKGKTNE
jgi:hypothetical protein